MIHDAIECEVEILWNNVLFFQTCLPNFVPNKSIKQSNTVVKNELNKICRIIKCLIKQNFPKLKKLISHLFNEIFGWSQWKWNRMISFSTFFSICRYINFKAQYLKFGLKEGKMYEYQKKTHPWIYHSKVCILLFLRYYRTTVL